MSVEDRKPQAGGAKKETMALFVSAICLAGVIHVEWKLLDFDTQMVLQGNDYRSWSNGKHKSGLTDEGMSRSKRSTTDSPTVREFRQIVREELHDILQREFCRNKEQICIKGEQGERGKRGRTGPSGKPGHKGEKGSRGSRGLQGLLGKHGPIGPRGPVGMKGEQGPSGNIGLPGPKGEKGEMGRNGKPGVPGQPISAPIISSPNVSLILNESEDAVLYCEVEANPAAKVSWSKVNSSLPSGRYAVWSDNRIVIRDVQSIDTGTFLCIANNILGSAQVSSQILVQVPPTFVVKPMDIITEEGKSVVLVCVVSGKPSPRIWWTKVPKDLLARKLLYLQGRLTLTNVTKQDQGIYMCHAENILGKISTSAQITVFSELRFVIFPPKAMMAVLGERLEVHCAATSDFRPIVSWIMLGRPFMPSGTMMYPNGTLVISKVAMSHQGIYNCLAASQISTIEAAVNVTVKYPESCSIIRKFVTKISGNYIIDPSGVDDVAPFVVYCNMSERDGDGITVISHDSEDTIMVDGCEPKGCYLRKVQYTGANIKQLASLTKVSASCEQFIKYECHNTWFLGEGYAWWVSRDGEKMMHWGGAPVGSGKCACGITNSCDGGWKCNCDYLERRWKEDSGFLRDKSVLPVSELRFGDVGGSDERGRHTLGKLKCYGIA